MKKVELYFDFSCPWSYLALLRLRDAADRNAAAMILKPVSIEQILATENPNLQLTRWSDNPAKAAWQKQDIQHWAAMWGLTLSLPEHWPFDAALAGAGMCAAAEASKGIEYALAVFAACFAAHADITQADVLVGLAEQLGLEPTTFRASLEASASTQMISDNSLEMIRRGGFGTPSMFIEDELFFGNDRVPLVEWTLGPIRDAGFVMPGQHSTY